MFFYMYFFKFNSLIFLLMEWSAAVMGLRCSHHCDWWPVGVCCCWALAPFFLVFLVCSLLSVSVVFAWVDKYFWLEEVYFIPMYGPAEFVCFLAIISCVGFSWDFRFLFTLINFFVYRTEHLSRIEYIRGKIK